MIFDCVYTGNYNNKLITFSPNLEINLFKFCVMLDVQLLVEKLLIFMHWLLTFKYLPSAFIKKVTYSQRNRTTSNKMSLKPPKKYEKSIMNDSIQYLCFTINIINYYSCAKSISLYLLPRKNIFCYCVLQQRIAYY